jgi:hypothetical protein
MYETETAIWKSLKRATEKDVHWTRIEARVGGGIPDINGAFLWPSNGQQTPIEMWVELKVCRTRSYKTAGLWRPAQIAWQTKRACVSPHVYNLVSHPEAQCIKIFDGSRAMDLQFDETGSIKPIEILKSPIDWSVFLGLVASRALGTSPPGP